ncbi:hybrid sensor histidine kinase/response regulator [Flammeovirga pectinis]|uniref:histidine kinase n=1 Tax=Flammeovirga pectinis TaxID=2494373 RepID=A0A3S9P7C5_9BACT|nr:two-component regulator propeller domain-containing protein [Flammeovirga pectinis]AZQ63992.1 hybrid sensor histidine kinase/response regulator [Flammeovirga pectinis]
MTKKSYWKTSFIVGLIIVLFTISNNCSANNKDLFLKHYTTKQGLSQNDVNCIYQDQTGLIWIGTNDGLSRFDGYEFKNYRIDSHNLPSNFIRTITEDNKGNLWIGTLNAGIYRLNLTTEQFTFFSNKEGKPKLFTNNTITNLIIDNKGNLWFGNRKGLNKIRSASLQTEALVVDKYYHNPHNNESIASNNITNLYIDKVGHLWVGSKKGLQLMIPPNNEDQFCVFRNFENKKLISLNAITENKGELLIASFDGIYQIQLSEITKENPTFKKVSDLKVGTLLSDDKNTIWAGNENGLYQLKKNALTGDLDEIGHQNSYNNDYIGSNIINTLYKDNLGVIWIGTNGSGINKYNPRRKKFTHFKQGENPLDLTYNKIRSTFQDNLGRIWIGTEGGGLNVFDNKKVRSLNVAKNKKAQNIVYAIEQWKDQLVFGVGYPSKTLIIPIDKALTLENKIIESTVHPTDHIFATFDIANDGDSILWLATYGGGIIKGIEKDKKFEWSFPTIIDKNDHEIDIIRSITIDKKGNIWFGTNKGLVFLSKEEKVKKNPYFEIFTNTKEVPSSLSYNYILPVFEASNGEIWVGTMGGGLNIFNPKKSTTTDINFEHLSTKNGLPSNVIKSILEDNYGNLWVASNKGLSKINLENRRIKNFDLTDGLQGDEFGELAAVKLNNGKLLFGGVNGINIFKPHEIIDDHTVASVIFTDLKILNNEINPYDSFLGNQILTSSLQSTKAIELPHNQNSFSFKFASLHYGASENNSYRYKLDGFDKDWVTVDAGQREAKYTNISPGNYILYVKASNCDGIWNPKAISMEITVLPPWWWSIWAKLFYVILVIVLIGFFSRFTIITARKKSQLEMEKFEREKLEDLSQLKLQFFTNISHELRTPLTLINTPIEQLIKKGNTVSTTDREKSYQMIFKNVQHLMRLVNQLLDFRKVEQGQMKLQLSKGNWSNFLDQVYHSFKEFAEYEHISFTYEHSSTSIEGYMDTDKLEKIVYNLLSNAFKFTHEGEIKLAVMQEADKVRVVLKDTGIGIPEEKLAYLFNRFYQVSNLKKAKNRGTGIGLAFTKSLVDLHHGTIAVESTLNVGTTFTLEFPLSATAYEGEIIEQVESTPSDVLEEYKEEMIDELEVNVKQKILVVDDNTSIRELLTDLLKDDYDVYSAENGQVGLQKAKDVLPNLILSDIMMPVMDGYEFTKSIRDDNHLCHLPIILLTAKNSEDSKLKGYEYGVDAYVTKPFNSEVLIARIQSLLENRKNQQKNFKTNIDVKPSEITYTSIDEKFLKRLVEIVEENISDSEFTVDKLASEYGATPIRLNQKLKSLTGQTAKGFIRNIRLKRAAQMLKIGRYSVSDVTYEVGFNDLKYFRNCFKKEFGIPPSIYLKENSTENEQQDLLEEIDNK